MSFEKDYKILIIGYGKYEFYEVALHNALCSLGYNADIFTWVSNRSDPFTNFINKIEGRLNFGLSLRKINKKLLKTCKEKKPDVVFFYNTRLFDKKTIDKIKQTGIKIIAFSNDDPFSGAYPEYWWKKYMYIAENADLVYAYRDINVEEYKAMGCKNVKLLLPYYMDNRNYCLSDEEKLKDIPDVVYIGHVENDGRKEYINALLKAGVKVGVKADTVSAFEQSENLIPIYDTHKKYNAILSSAKIALVFLSTKNRDKYTRRCFEIPATGAMMLSIYTEKLTEFFEEDREAVYFKTPEELVEKCKKYLADDKQREKIAKAGYDRLIKDGHEIKDRAMQVVRDCAQLF